MRKFPKIKVVKEIPRNQHFAVDLFMGVEYVGLCDGSKNTIWIRQDARWAIVHEFLHWCAWPIKNDGVYEWISCWLDDETKAKRWRRKWLSF